ncbi:CaiB/BaiF CoA transferase family protein [Paracidobacterium acidisoli]|uniref:CoA transferase n=1 Tax=Paracidobacterium acidisoli TaxID=2303751 RepID=A0A372ISH3_9BACT|nr:CaiB/BaiF CoA-transferase family protein [Paracidobacterium acidisoli]MBT9330829.1 CoA transferase [Paracidobacterium acidisoli]
MRPLEGLLVIDLSQFLSGPSASLRMADMGARVIKIEKPETGDLCRDLYISNLELDGDSTLFHSINRNKESFAADLKDDAGRAAVLALIDRADVVLHNFRPGVIEKLGLDYETVSARRPRVVYGEISGYGRSGPWAKKPGQDLLVQSLSGLAWLNGDAEQPPVPFGLAVADLYAGAHLCQGVLACLVRRGITGRGGRVEVSLLESVLDLQFEVLTTYLNDGGKVPQRSRHNNAHAYLGAPYGIYATQDGYLALAMGSLLQLAAILDCPALKLYSAPDAFDQRDEIKAMLAEHLRRQTTAYWLERLEPAGYWCADVFTWPRLMEHAAFDALDMLQTVGRDERVKMTTTRCPIRIDEELLKSERGAPRLGEDTEALRREFGLP